MKIWDFNRKVLEEDRVIENGFVFLVLVFRSLPPLFWKTEALYCIYKNCILTNERARLILLIPQANFFSWALNILLQYYFHLILYWQINTLIWLKFTCRLGQRAYGKIWGAKSHI